MKQLSEYQTPETDALRSIMENESFEEAYWKSNELSARLEQRFNARGDALELALEVIEATGPGSYPEAEKQIRETLNLTKP